MGRFCFIVLAVILFPFLLNVLIQVKWPLWNVVGDEMSWMSFWGAYLGAVGTFVMAYYAYVTLKRNKEQFDYIKEQNRPRIQTSLRKFIQLKENIDENGEPTGNFYRSHTYYLLIYNYGHQPAMNVHIEISLNNTDCVQNERLSSKLADICRCKFDLPSNKEKNFVVANISFPAGLSKEQMREERAFFDALEKCVFEIKITYNDGLDSFKEENILYVKDSIADSTTIVQMLDYIDNSIRKLGDKIGSCSGIR